MSRFITQGDFKKDSISHVDSSRSIYDQGSCYNLKNWFRGLFGLPPEPPKLVLNIPQLHQSVSRPEYYDEYRKCQTCNKNIKVEVESHSYRSEDKTIYQKGKFDTRRFEYKKDFVCHVCNVKSECKYRKGPTRCKDCKRTFYIETFTDVYGRVRFYKRWNDKTKRPINGNPQWEDTDNPTLKDYKYSFELCDKCIGVRITNKVQQEFEKKRRIQRRIQRQRTEKIERMKREEFLNKIKSLPKCELCNDLATQNITVSTANGYRKTYESCSRHTGCFESRAGTVY